MHSLPIIPNFGDVKFASPLGLPSDCRQLLEWKELLAKHPEISLLVLALAVIKCEFG